MKFNCSIADDLLPLYLENACSEDSRAALEEHLKSCPGCRGKLERMKETNLIPQAVMAGSELQVTGYAKRVKRHRIRLAIFAVLASILAACVLSVCFLTIKDMRTQANPTVCDVEDGVYNLTAGELETTAAEVGKYILYTNHTQIRVIIQETGDVNDELLLWNAENDTGPILYGKIDSDTNTCTFTGLSSSERYRVTYHGNKEAAITISEGRVVNFWNSFENVMREIMEMIRY